MEISQAKVATDTIAQSIDLIIDITILFFMIAFFLFVAVSLLQIYLERKRGAIESKKLDFIHQINLFLFDDTIEIKAKKHNDKIALVEAIIEVYNFMTKEDSRILIDIIEKNQLALFLYEAYQKSYFAFQKISYFNKMISLHYPPYKSFFFKKMKNRHFSMQQEALYGFASLCNNQKDLKSIAHVMTNRIKYRGISYLYDRFIFEEAFKEVPPSEIESFVKTLNFYNHITIKSVLQTIADMRNPQLYHCIIDIYQREQNNEDFIIHTIKILSKLKYSYCQIIKNSYLHESMQVKLVCAQHAFELCGKSALEFIYLYFLDKDSHLIKTLLSSTKTFGLKYSDILDVIERKKPSNASPSIIGDSTAYNETM